MEMRPQESLSTAVTRAVLVLPSVLFGALTVATHAARFLRLTFREYAIVSGLLSLVVLAVWVWAWRRDRPEITRRDGGLLVVVLLAGVVGAVMALVYRLPDMDDFSYVPDAVHFLTFPDEHLGYTIHYGYMGEQPPFTIIEWTSQPFEYIQALVAWGLGLEFLDVYYFLAVAAAGFCVPLAIFLLLSHFSDGEREAALATLLVVGVWTLLGEGKNTPGSLSFTRIFQGKIVLFACGVPLFAALSLDFLARPSLVRWGVLAVVAAAMSGLTSTAFFVIPMLALCLGLADLFARGWGRRRIGAVAVYGASLAYLVGYAYYASRAVTRFFDLEQLPGSWPSTFGGHLATFLDLERPVTAGVLLASLAVVVLLGAGPRRRLLLAWTAAAILLFLNPLVAGWWIFGLTGPMIYWRAFYILPLVAMVGAAFILLLRRLPRARPWAGVALTCGGLLACLVLNLIPGSTSIFRRGGEIGWPAYKLVDQAVEVGRDVIAHAPPGAMLAPREIAGTVPMLRGGYPQLRIRSDPLAFWMLGQADRRIRASNFSDGQLEYRPEFEKLVSSTDALRTIVLRSDVYPIVEAFLAAHGFAHSLASGSYSIVWR